MSYLVLARKYRPRNFADVVGQDHVVRALANALDSERLHHAYLFTGTRGVGKTTLARILAACLNCETGVTSTPCGSCSACEAISVGRFIDLIEVDAASRTGVDDTRELMTNAQFMPGQGRFKVYLIDEVHMLSGASFNALLKTLEEPPEHVKFLLATTEARKIPVTVLSRCLQFHLKNMLPEAIEGQLERILAAEEVAAEAEALKSIARSAQGSMRDALSIADQAISHGGGAVVADSVNAMLGIAGRDETGALLDALSEQKGDALLAAADDLAGRSLDLPAVLDELLRALHELAVAAELGTAPAEPYGRFAGKFAPEDLQIYYQIALLGARDLPFAPDPKVGFDMTMIRLASFEPLGDASAGDSTAATSAEAGESAGSAVRARPETSQSSRRAADPAVAPSGESRPAGAAPAKPSPRAPAAPNSAPTQPAEQPWHEVVASMAPTGVASMILDHSNLAERSGNQWTIRLPEDHEALLNDTQRREIERLAERYQGRPVELRFEIGELLDETPSARHAREKTENEAAAKAALLGDDNVRMLIRDFDAKLESPRLHAPGT